MKKNKLFRLITAAVMIAPMINSIPQTAFAKDSGIMRVMSTMEIVEDMGIGINLGNTFESCGDWDNRPIWTGY